MNLLKSKYNVIAPAFTVGILQLGMTPSAEAISIFTDTFTVAAQTNLANDSAGNLDSQDTWFRIGEGTRVRFAESTNPDLDDSIYMGFQYQNNNANIVLSSTWDNTMDYTFTINYFVDTARLREDGVFQIGYGDGTSRTASTNLSSDFMDNTAGAHTYTKTFAAGTLTAADASNIYLRIRVPGAQGAQSATTGNSSVYYIQDVTVDASPIPEPSSTALLGLGALALILRRRK